MDPQLTLPLLAGDTVGRYRVEGFVAEGGMGQVFRAWDTTLERHVALKVVRADHAGDRETLLRFQREAQILARLDHAGICRVYDWLDRDGTLVMAMEWVEGASLAALVEKGPLPVHQAMRLLRDVATALAAAHAKGVIHRDLKPSNILIRENGRAVVLDFGLAKEYGPLPADGLAGDWVALAEEEATAFMSPDRTNPLTMPGLVLGTRGYMAPELLRGAPASPATDLYALGVIAHLMLTGGPYQAQKEKPLSWPRRVLRPPAASGPSRLGSHALWTLVDRLLSLEPHDRPQAQELADALGRILAPPAKAWWMALTAGLTLAAAAMALWVYGRGAIPEFSAARPARIVVVPVRNLTRNPGLAVPVEIGTTELLEAALLSLPQLRVVPDRVADPRGNESRPRLEATEGEAERAFIQRVVGRTGVDLVLLGEVQRDAGSGRILLRVRLLDRAGATRSAVEAAADSGLDYEPETAVPAVLQGIERHLSPLRAPRAAPALPPQEALEAYGRGQVLLDQSRDGEALPWMRKASLLAPQYAPAIQGYGKALYWTRDPGALPAYMWARAVARESGDRRSEIGALIGLSVLAHNSDRLEPMKEEALLSEALALGKAAGDMDLQAEVLNLLGVYWTQKGDWATAELRLKPALELFTVTGNNQRKASVLINLANAAKVAGRLDETQRLYLEAASVAYQAGNLLLEITSRNNLAVMALEEGRMDEAEREFQHVLRIRREFKDDEGEGRVLLNLGIVAFMRGALDQAEVLFQDSLRVAEKIPHLQTQGRALFWLGDLRRARGDLAGATQRLQAAWGLLERKGTNDNQAAVLAALAECQARQGRLGEAERLLDEARQIKSVLPQIWRAQAWIHHQQGRRQAALDCLGRALEDPGHDDPEHQREVRALIKAWRKGS